MIILLNLNQTFIINRLESAPNHSLFDQQSLKKTRPRTVIQ